jgi:hypothetical protein
VAGGVSFRNEIFSEAIGWGPNARRIHVWFLLHGVATKQVELDGVACIPGGLLACGKRPPGNPGVLSHRYNMKQGAVRHKSSLSLRSQEGRRAHVPGG